MAAKIKINTQDLMESCSLAITTMNDEELEMECNKYYELSTILKVTSNGSIKFHKTVLSTWKQK